MLFPQVTRTCLAPNPSVTTSPLVWHCCQEEFSLYSPTSRARELSFPLSSKQRVVVRSPEQKALGQWAAQHLSHSTYFADAELLLPVLIYVSLLGHCSVIAT